MSWFVDAGSNHECNTENSRKVVHDIECGNAPSDSVSSISWSPRANLLAAGSWNQEVRIWQIEANRKNAKGMSLIKHDAPILSIHWSHDGNNIYAGSCNKTLTFWNPKISKPHVIGSHDAPIKCIALNRQHPNVIVTGSWDSSIKYWDPRANSSNNTAMGKIDLSERVYAMDFHDNMLAVAMAGNKISVLDIRKPKQTMYDTTTPLKAQLRAISCFNDCAGYVVGSIEGRVAIQYISEINDSSHLNQNKKDRLSFTFRCHRNAENGYTYAVNSVEFHRKYGTFFSAGSDGHIHCWDWKSKTRVHAWDNLKNKYYSQTIRKHRNQFGKVKRQDDIVVAITDLKLNKDCNLMAYAMSYDWTKGIEFYKPDVIKPRIFVHRLQDGECFLSKK